MTTAILDPPVTMTTTATGCLIQYVEIWTPVTGAADKLQLESASVIEPSGTRKISPETTEISVGVGIIGSSLQQRSPVIFADMTSEDLIRVQSETGIDITALLVFPVFNGSDLVNVIMFGFVDGHGAVEIWTRDDRDELSVSGSFYRGLSTFEYISQHVKFPKGAGVPGFCWKYSQPKMINDPQKNPVFIRSFDRDPAVLSTVIGMPISREYGFPAAVLLLLSADQTPLANYAAVLQTSSEKPTEENPTPPIELEKILNSSDSQSQITWHSSIAKRVSETQSACLLGSDDVADDSHSGIAIPFYRDSAVDRIIVLAF